MKRAVITGTRRIEIEEVPYPKVNGSPVIRVTHCGICGSDVHSWEEGDDYKGLVMGHEYTGIIDDPAGTGLHKGDRVLGYTQNPFNEPCGWCGPCLNSDFAGCSNRVVKVAIGCEKEHPGAYSEYMTWYPRALFKLPDDVSNEEAALIEPAAVALHAVSLSGLKPGDNVLILGGGIIGMCVAEWVRAAGAGAITISEANPAKMEKIRSLRIADTVLDARDKNIEARLKDIAPGKFDLFFDCVALEEPLNMAIRNLRRGGTGVLVGVALHPLSVDLWSTVIYQLRLQGSKGHVPSDFAAVIKALQFKKIDLKKYISHKVRLEGVQQAMEEIKARGDSFKVLIEF